MSIMPLSMKITTFLRFLVFLHGVQKVRSSVHVFGDIENFRPPYTNALSAVDDFWSPRHFYFCKFSMLNNYFPRRFHFFDFFHVHNAYFNENNHIFTIFGLFTWYELAPGMRKNTFGKAPRSAKTLDVLLRKRPGAPKRSMYLGNAPNPGLISGLMFIVFIFSMSGASSYPTPTTCFKRY